MGAATVEFQFADKSLGVDAGRQEIANRQGADTVDAAPASGFERWSSEKSMV